MVPQLDNSRTDGPIRTCIGCRERATKRELLRIVAGTDAEDHQGSQNGSWFVVPDPSGTARGRGAHLHPTIGCLALAERKRAFARALRHDAGVRGALSVERLREHLEQLDQKLLDQKQLDQKQANQAQAAPEPSSSAPTKNWSISS